MHREGKGEASVSMATDRCFLCREPESLQLSHVIPKFATNWIKRTSGKPGHKRLRRGYDDAISQDGPKFHMFCRNCEQLLGKDETEFSKRAFGKSYFLSSGRTPYGEWMLRFAVGLMLRVCVAELHFLKPAEDARLLTDKEIRAIEKACDDFRGYLDGSNIWPGKLTPLRLNFGFTSYPADGVIRNHLDYYMTRGTDACIVIGDGILAAYAHIPFHVFWTQITPRRVKNSDWPNCRIRKRGFVDPNLEQRAPDYFRRFLDSRLEVTDSTFSATLKRTIEFVEPESR